MTHELLKRISALRGINPRLNSVTDQATEIVRSIEKTLVEELKIGIDATEWFLTESGAEPGVTRQHYLAFNRVGSTGYRINVSIVTNRGTPQEIGDSATTKKLEEERILWPSCSRELKLKAFEKLPDLLDKIIKSAEGLLQSADDTVSRINEMFGGSEPLSMAQPEDSGGRSRRRLYSVQDAIRAHRQYFLDQGLSDAALNSFLSDGWVQVKRRKFACRDLAGTERCCVEFVDDHGSAEITFAGGEADSVTIEDEDQDDDE